MNPVARPNPDARLDVLESRFARTPDLALDFRTNRDLIAEILRLRDEKNVLLLGHNYMHPLIYHLSDEVARGDSLALSRVAAESNQPIILFNGVRFMAETAKILNPEKKVLIADLEAGCSLADGLRAEDALALRERHPGAPVVTYINSYAEVKAESDFCCTSANALRIVRHAARRFNTDRVIFLPDTLMGANLQAELNRLGEAIELVYPGRPGCPGDDEPNGRPTRCEVHERFTAGQIRAIRAQYDMPKGSRVSAVLVHWECPPEVVAEADFHGSTSEMARYIEERPDLRRVYLATECEMAANLAVDFPSVEFVRACSFFCPHMRRITLEKLHRSLVEEVHEVTVPRDVAARARVAIDRMLALA